MQFLLMYIVAMYVDRLDTPETFLIHANIDFDRKLHLYSGPRPGIANRTPAPRYSVFALCLQVCPFLL